MHHCTLLEVVKCYSLSHEPKEQTPWETDRQSDYGDTGQECSGRSQRNQHIFLNEIKLESSENQLVHNERVLRTEPSRCGLCSPLLSRPASPVQVMFYYPWVSAPIQCQPERWSQHGGGRGLSCLRANGKEWQESATDNAMLGDVRQQIIFHILPLP